MRGGKCEVNQETFLRWARKRFQYLDNASKRQNVYWWFWKRRLQKSQLLTATAIFLQVLSEELDTQLTANMSKRKGKTQYSRFNQI